jgi:hypothetical protein
MTTTIIGIIITAIAIEADKLTLYKHHIFPMVALASTLATVISLAL